MNCGALLTGQGFIPHGHCYMWNPLVLWLNVGSDLLIMASYFTIPLALVRFARSRPDVKFTYIFILFGLFIFLCGLSHLFGAITVWEPLYFEDGLIKAATGIVSAATSIVLYRLLPAAIALPSQAQLQETNRALEEEIHRRRTIEGELRALNETLEQRIEARTIELDAARKAAQEASRAKSDFLATMSHEIRTPLNSIVGMADLLRSSELNQDQREYIRVLNQSSLAVLNLVSGILDLSKIENNQLQLEESVFDPRAAVTAALDIISVRATEKGLRLVQSIDSEVPKFVVGDSLRLQQILNNLLSNAVKFTEQGEIRVELKLAEETSDKVRLRFLVRDTGLGIPADKLEVVFADYVQADASVSRRFGGTGLGLAISKKLVELMNGRIWAESSGEGSSFYFEVLLKKTDAKGVEQVRHSETALHGATDDNPKPIDQEGATPLKILVVDDSTDNLSVIRAYFKRSPHTIETAGNGAEAVQKAKEHDYDIILMDLQMPVLDGFQATMQIRSWEAATNRRRIPIIALTAFALKEERDRSLAAGCDLHITKPITRSALFTAIASVEPATKK